MKNTKNDEEDGVGITYGRDDGLLSPRTFSSIQYSIFRKQVDVDKGSFRVAICWGIDRLSK